jgi:N-acetylneuraminic acid mutarotase
MGSERPERLSEHSAVYDQDRQEMIVFGGTHAVPTNCQVDGTAQFTNETWVYDDPCGKWALVATAPTLRGRHSAAWGGGVMWVFGGRSREGTIGNYTLYDDLLRFDVGAREWSQIAVDGLKPSKRATSAIAYDTKRARLWMFGGNLAESGLIYEPTDDLWNYDIGTGEWAPEVTAVAPSARLFHSMTYDVKRDWLLVFGGGNETAFDSFPVYFSDIWAYDIEAGQWLEIAAQGSGPLGRFWSSLVHDNDTDTYVVFGGHDPGTLVTRDETLGNLNDAWRFDPDSGQWTELAAGDQYNVPNRGFCDFPPDFATLDYSLPERRMAHSLVWSESCEHAILFGGKTDCGSTDDVWTHSRDGWRKLLGAREGEVCHRWRTDRDRCSDICF